MARFQDVQVVKLLRALPEYGLNAGDHGTIVMVYPQMPQAYEVEFVDGEGKTTALVTLLEEDLEGIEQLSF